MMAPRMLPHLSIGHARRNTIGNFNLTYLTSGIRSRITDSRLTRDTIVQAKVFLIRLSNIKDKFPMLKMIQTPSVDLPLIRAVRH